MKNIYRLLLFLLFLPSFTLAADKGGGGAGKFPGWGSVTRTSFGYGWSTIEKSENTSVNQFTKPKTWWQDIDFLAPMGLHIGLRETFEQDAQVNFTSGTKRGEIYMTAIEIGAFIKAPLTWFQPYFGAGLTGGFLAITDPTDRRNHNYLAAFDKETQVIRGYYGTWGIDFVLQSGVGLRLAYQAETINTDKFANLGDTRMAFNHSRVSAGFTAWLR